MKTSKEDFELFKAECWKWIRFFGLINWEIAFMHKECTSSSMAWIEPYESDKVVLIFLNKIWIDDKYFYSKDEIKLLAFHEICELLLSKFDDLAKERFGITESSLLSARHEIIHTLENSVYEKLKMEV